MTISFPSIFHLRSPFMCHVLFSNISIPLISSPHLVISFLHVAYYHISFSSPHISFHLLTFHFTSSLISFPFIAYHVLMSHYLFILQLLSLSPYRMHPSLSFTFAYPYPVIPISLAKGYFIMDYFFLLILVIFLYLLVGRFQVI